MEERLSLIKNKIEKLLTQNKEEKALLLSEKEAVKEELKKLEIKFETQRIEKENIENKLNFYTLAPENLTKKEIKQKINQYISEIDSCIRQIENI